MIEYSYNLFSLLETNTFNVFVKFADEKLNLSTAHRDEVVKMTQRGDIVFLTTESGAEYKLGLIF